MALALIVYYSLTTNTKFVSDLIVEELNKNNIQATVEVVSYSGVKPGFFSTINQGFKMLGSNSQKLDSPPQNDPRKFKYVLFGGPVWWYKIAPPLNEWLKTVEYDPESTNFAAFITCGSSGYEKGFKQIEDITKKPLTSKLHFVAKELSKNTEDVHKKVEEFVKALIAQRNVAHIDVKEVKTLGKGNEL
ncbi:MAG: hypothetical protein EZS28_041835 [Streblomastix strix]|uniref:Flavodoxin-like domain-containing protein n=1 Tax=Streblomastix strix TaxID=222440 RepID=A0A5J4TX17_9EUKA|nr:MAG: hypothetical protein EZS28_041835 [Streblomastix strix]